jgi:hypothetical protein
VAQSPRRSTRRAPRKRSFLGQRKLILIGAIAAITALIAVGYRNATADPIVRVAEVDSPELSGSQPIKILFLSDTHVQGPDMPPERLARIVERLNGLHPDLVLLGGDYIGHKLLGTRSYSMQDAIEPLGDFHPRLGIYAVLGNHDRAQADEVRAAMSAIGGNLLEDEAIQVGPVAVGGIYERGARVARRLADLSGPKFIITHRPDPVVRMSPLFTLTLAGHTHCGQIVLPIVGPLATGSTLPKRYSCGFTRFEGKPLIVGAGLGTSQLPLRYGAPPDVWLIIVRPAADRRTNLRTEP